MSTAVSTIKKMLDREGLEKHIENKREELRAGSVDKEAKMWAEQLEEAERKRGAFQNQQAEGLITIDELRAKLDSLEKARLEARDRLEELARRKDEIESLEQGAEALISSYSAQVREEGMTTGDRESVTALTGVCNSPSRRSLMLPCSPTFSCCESPRP